MGRTPALMMPGLVLSAWTAASLAGEEPANSHVRLVLGNLAEKKYALPDGDYLLLARQPQGVVSDTVVYELDAGRIAFVPGTHSTAPLRCQTLSPAQAKLLREVAALDSVQTLPRDNGKFGMDGWALVAVMRLSGRTKIIGHWAPDAPAVELLAGILDRELNVGTRRPPSRGGP